MKIFVAAMAVVIALPLSVDVAYSRGGGGGGFGGGGFGAGGFHGGAPMGVQGSYGGGHSGPHGFHGGYHHDGHYHDAHVGVYFGWPRYYDGWPYLYYYPGYYPYSDYWAYPSGTIAVVPWSPQDWYYCDNPQGYYPFVAVCTSGWHAVPATPAPYASASTQ